MAEPLIASGEQIVIGAGDLRLTVVTVGGGMRELTLGDWHVVDGYAADEVAPGAAGQPLIPWPNRLAGGRYGFAGRTHQVPINEPERNNSLHGLSRWMAWRVERREASRALLALDLYPRPGYPFALRLGIEYEAVPDAVRVRTTALNAGTSAAPYAQGFHPYVSTGAASIDGCMLEVPARTWLPTDERQIPTGRRPVDGTPLDFRTSRTIGDTRLDFAYTDLARDPDGMARVRVAAAGGSRRVTVWMDRAYEYVMAFTGDTLPDAARRRRALGVEPMTAAPNAFNSGDGLRVLEPGESFRCEWGLELG
jgi:aldose 1-epimerase